MNPVLSEILRTGKVTAEGSEQFPLAEAISKEEGFFLQRIIAKIKPQVSVEVGFAFGVSTLFICEALEGIGPKHLLHVIDPYQNTLWKGIGLRNLRRAGYGEFVRFMGVPSELALPELLRNGTRLDFAFVDGFHTFDHALLDFFYVNAMLNVGGVVVFDDNTWNSVHRLCRLIARYPCYTIMDSLGSPVMRLAALKTILRDFFDLNDLRLPRSPLQNLRFLRQDLDLVYAGRMVAFRKIKPDERSQFWYEKF